MVTSPLPTQSGSASQPEMERQGVVLHHDHQGRLIRAQTYNQGLLHGESRHYGETGLMTQRMFYVENKLHGPFEAFEEGKIVLNTFYVEGKQHGQTTFYDETGMVKMRMHYQEGRLEGPCLSYDAMGNVQQIFHYHQDVKHGPSLTYFPSGSVLERGFYANGLQEGNVEAFYETGVLRQVSKFHAGRLMEAPLLYDTTGKRVLKSA